MKGKRIIIWTVIIAIVVAIIVFVSKKASSAGTDGSGSTSGGSKSGGSSAKNLDVTKILKLGSGYTSNNAEVKELQRILNQMEPANALSIDGLFGPKTEAKLKRVNNGFGQTTLAQITNQQVGLNDGMLGWTRFF